jgi:hypothetical protein
VRELEQIRVRLGRCVRFAVLLATSAVLLAPLLLGPGSAWALRALGGTPEHHCACGMKPGTCGCPECERIEHERNEAKRPLKYAALRSSCDDSDAPIASAALPVVDSANLLSVILSPFARVLPETRTPALNAGRRPEPPTPPPRAA